MQESQSGLYVTVPENQQQAANDTQEIVIRTLGNTGTLTNSVRRSGTSGSKPQRTNSNANTGSSLDHRGKKIVAMPESLYNHFRPVEDNIPIEDMSQFLYFGQKLRYIFNHKVLRKCN
ncbi:hypothetical protein QAD02_016434 [Eretmocerus hayati]|uniref:Uncharacterized protein n=1 Tax=Eretmocerus hayati TaxID=131215 RepID=A0ACC2PBG2_9HYME|nr:hypothetical protein QAD02_016434 [Eretmocerus hayati]